MSNISESNRGPGRPASNNKPVVDIKLDSHFTARVYTSGSTVSGNVIVNCQRDTPFNDVDITFTGIAATRLDFVQSYTTNAVRCFMKLRMPLNDSDLPESRVFTAGTTYNVPFHFVVPHQVTMGSCNHGCEVPAVQDQHLRMPPTLGYWSGDDQAPDMTHIEYAVKAKIVTRHSERAAGNGNNNSGNYLQEAKKIIKVLPASPEEPPMDITFRDERYCLTKTKTFRKNLLGAKSGELTASAPQPEAVMLHADGFGAHESNARINLAFTPATADATPPKINSVSGKIISTTFFGAAPASDLPNMGPKTTYSHNQVLTYSSTTPLFNNTRPDKVQWSEQPIPPFVRRDSGYGTAESSDEDPQQQQQQQQSQSRSSSRSKPSKSPKPAPTTHHVASLDLPIKVPVSNKRTFVPTFHNCIMSRTYTLQLTLSVGASSTTMMLSVPLQLGVEKVFDEEELPSFETAVAQAEADSFLNGSARNVAMVRDQSSRGNVLPGYDELRGRSVACA